MNRRSICLFATGVVLFLVGLLTWAVPPAMSQANVTGQWQTLPYTMPINPVHVSLLYTGKVLISTGSGNDNLNTTFQAGLWDPQAGTITLQRIDYDFFCNGMITLPDGRAIIAGGTLAYGPPFLGLPRMTIYDPATGVFADQPSMGHGRWYPTLTTLGDGRVFVFSGLTETGPTNVAVEIYNPSSGWSPEFAAPWTPPLYPRMHLLPNGNLFYSGNTAHSAFFNPSNNTWTMNVATTQYGGTRLYGSSVLLPLTPANGYKPRVIILGGGTTTTPATNTTELIDLSVAQPQWVFGPPMSAPRIEMDATMLPDGRILALGGSTNDEDPSTASLNADLYNPVSNAFSPAGAEAFARLYHTVSLLMPDGTVWVAGGNPSQRNYEPHMEIYSPPYLFNSDGSLATRPTISSVSAAKIGYGTPFQIQTPDAANISSVVLMRNGSSTHAFDMDQRYVGLSFTAGSGVLNATSPPNGNIAPPGYYMLFILNASGVPSVASMVQVLAAPNDQPPTGTITNPATGVTINAGQSTTFAGTGTDSDGTIASYYWTFFGGNPVSSSLPNPGQVTYNTPGNYVATLTVTDNQGLTDPHPPSRNITVPDYSLSVSPSIRSVTQGASAPYTLTVTGNPGFAGNVAFSVSGLPTGATASFSPASVTNSGTSTMTVSTSATTPVGGYSLAVTASTGPASHTTTASLIVSSGTSPTVIDLSSGFSAAGMQFNGNALLNGTRLQLTNNNTPNARGSAFWKTPVNVQSFTTDFTFQVTNANADGFTFTVQDVGPTALGASGSGLGFGGLPTSVAVKFDIYNNNGEGPNSTGLYVNGASPTTPSTTFGGGINLHSGDLFQVHIVYDGTTLTMTVTDTTVTASFTTSWPINIPGAVGANTAYAGFTGGSGGQSATQEILNWTYNTGAASPAATPVIAPATGTYTTAQSVTITDSTTGSAIFYTVDGSPPTPTSTPYTGAFTVSATTTVKAIATAPNFATSATAASVITIQTGGTTAINFGSGFSAAGMQFNGHTKLNGPRLQLTDGTTTMEQASGYWTTAVNVQTFTNDFTFQLTNANADGFTFVLQNSGLTAMGTVGGGLGFAGIPASVAVKFDLFNNAGEGTNSTGLFTKGAAPTIPATTLGGGVNLHSGDILQVHMTYDGTTLTMTITDTVVPTNTFTTSWPINIPATIGANTAFAGFTAGTGGQTATQEILTWTYNTSAAATPAATPTFTPAAGTYSGTQSVTIADTTAGASIFYTLDGTTPATTAGGSTVKYTTPIAVAASKTINAIATAAGFSTSAVGSAAYVINTLTPAATPMIAPATGTYTTAQSVTITDSTTGSAIFYTVDGSPPTPTSTPYTGAFTVSATTTVKAIATAPNFATSATAASVITIQTGGTTAINFGSGFSAAGMQFNGHTKLNGPRLQLTDGTTTMEQASGYWTTAVNVQTFTNDFTFQLTNANADGFTFVLQNSGLTAMGTVGGGLGFAGIPASVAVKFDLFNNAGEGTNSTGLFTKGAAPTIPATTLGGGVNLHSGDILQVHMTYDGTTLTMTITDTVVPTNTFTTSWPINIPATIGANTAFAGFTAGTGGQTATQEILTWTYNTSAAATPAATPTFTPAAGTYSGTQSVTIADTTAGASIFYTLDGTTPATTAGGSTVKYTTPIAVAASKTINAIATAAGFSTSAVGSAAYVINTLTPAATPMIAPATGTYTTAQSVTITDSTTGSAIFYTVDGSPPTPTSTPYTGAFTVSATTTVKAIATAPNFATSATAASVITIQTGGTTAINFGSGFSAAGMQFNGHTKLNGPRLQLTDGTTTMEQASGYWTTAVNVQTFTNDFTFQLTNANADGFTFVLQNSGLTAMGTVGGGLGFAGIPASVAVKFDLFNNAGEGTNSTGLFTKGAAPTIPATTLGGGVNLHSGDILQVHMTYDGTTLTMTITDTVVPTNTFTMSWPINIPATIGANTAFAGFTAGTGGQTATQEILTWTYTH